MKHMCPQCETEMSNKEEKYPGEHGLYVILKVCDKCEFTYLSHKEEWLLDKKLLQRRNDEIAKLKEEIVILKRRLGNE